MVMGKDFDNGCYGSWLFMSARVCLATYQASTFSYPPIPGLISMAICKNFNSLSLHRHVNHSYICMTLAKYQSILWFGTARKINFKTDDSQLCNDTGNYSCMWTFKSCKARPVTSTTKSIPYVNNATLVRHKGEIRHKRYCNMIPVTVYRWYRENNHILSK